jgi:hypothetical protein
MNPTLRHGLATLALAATPAAHAVTPMPQDAYGLFGYASGAQVAVYGVGASWDLRERSAARDEAGLGIRLDAGVSYWWGKGRPTPYPQLWDFSATPIFRWTFASPASPRTFVEGGLGIHLLTHTRINNDRIFSTAFQFGEYVAVGVAFGPRNAYEVKLLGQHVSNAGIKLPNWGLTYPGIAVSVALP